LYGASLINDISPVNKFSITAYKINIESYSIDGESIINESNSSENTPWGI
jgi:hypothetical protein